MAIGPMARRLVALALASLVAGCGIPALPTATNSPPPRNAHTGPGVAVAAGDTLYGIAKKHNVALRALIEANGLSAPYTIYPGQRLALPGAARTHMVKRGETVYSVSRDYGVDSTTVARLNQLPPPYAVTPGTRLVLPESPPVRQASAAPQPARAQPAPASAPAPLPQPQTVATIPAMAPDDPISSGPPMLRPPPDAADRVVSPPPEQPVAALPPPELVPLANVPARAGRFEWPVRGKILARYGAQGKGLHNDGINIAARPGTVVRAAESGVVAYAGNELRGFGNLLIIKHADGWVTAYAHNERLLVSRGSTVRRGQDIAVVGATGNVSEPQLHFEIRRGQRALDPLRYLGPTTASVVPAKAGIQIGEANRGVPPGRE